MNGDTPTPARGEDDGQSDGPKYAPRNREKVGGKGRGVERKGKKIRQTDFEFNPTE